ncbi:DUF4235 domain-containing protein [Roseimaritima sediminicola]|uniref:DUF4235 domain-containing protein n=1 Tax=Roseimaritima sediminicola TaxID=2662066 RepID=UPI00129823FB|nr:DUF4235 domain-containing protein [Roseimaritima sediminicola]
MLDELRNGYEDVQSRVRGMTMGDQPDGKNEGVGQMENMLAFAAAIGAGFLARQLLQNSWRAAFQQDPPKNPASHEVDWQDALLWGALSGAIVGAARIASRRSASSAYRKFRS